eukprot:781489_1
MIPGLSADWIPDDDAPECMCCAAEFSFTTRRHHCRGCGVVVCSKCSRARAILRVPTQRLMRVCTGCQCELEHLRSGLDPQTALDFIYQVVEPTKNETKQSIIDLISSVKEECFGEPHDEASDSSTSTPSDGGTPLSSGPVTSAADGDASCPSPTPSEKKREFSEESFPSELSRASLDGSVDARGFVCHALFKARMFTDGAAQWSRRVFGLTEDGWIVMSGAVHGPVPAKVRNETSASERFPNKLTVHLVRPVRCVREMRQVDIHDLRYCGRRFAVLDGYRCRREKSSGWSSNIFRSFGFFFEAQRNNAKRGRSHARLYYYPTSQRSLVTSKSNFV